MDRGELREKRTRYKKMFWSSYHISWLHSQLFLILLVSHLCVLRSTSRCREFLLLFSDHALRRCSDGRVHANPGVFMIILLAVVYFANLNLNQVSCHMCSSLFLSVFFWLLSSYWFCCPIVFQKRSLISHLRWIDCIKRYHFYLT